MKIEVDFSKPAGRLRETGVPGFPGLRLGLLHRPLRVSLGEDLAAGSRAVSVFLVNRRPAIDDDDHRDEAFTFQTELVLEAADGFLGRPDLRGAQIDLDWDELVADLQYRADCEYGTGHNVATEAQVDSHGVCRAVKTTWLPRAEVERVAPAPLWDLPTEIFAMDYLAGLQDPGMLTPLIESYVSWIAAQRGSLAELNSSRRGTADTLLLQAAAVAKRMEAGVRALGDPQVLQAFQLANGAMASAGRRRAVIENRTVDTRGPVWRPFQLAFLLLNLVSIADPSSADREFVDLLFFPTGGGKTEAYLGLSAFTLLLRRLRNPSISSAGVTVLMRYTLRLLTLDQLGRAATLICALDEMRVKDVHSPHCHGAAYMQATSNSSTVFFTLC